MNTLYKTLSLYLPKKQNNCFKKPCLYATNGKDMISLYSFNNYYKIIEYKDYDDYIPNRTRFMFASTFIKKGYRIIETEKEYNEIYSELEVVDLPF